MAMLERKFMNLSVSDLIVVDGLLKIAASKKIARLLQLRHGGKWHDDDPYVPQALISKLRLREGQYINGHAVMDTSSRGMRLIHVDAVDGLPVEQRRNCLPFSRATILSPMEQIKLESEGMPMSTRVIDLFAPIGRGQRCLVVAPPKAGKTILLQQIAKGIAANYPDFHLMTLLVDERPEEVTDFRRNAPVEIFASSNDDSTKDHLEVANLAFLHAQHLVEAGKHVVLLLDSLTRLARAYNSSSARGGKIMSGGLDSQALEKPRQLFALARNTEEIGSLTIVATILVETGSRMDDIIFQEFKGTGNCEIVLDRKIAEKRIFPAVNLYATGTRREELLLSAEALEVSRIFRRAFAGSRPDVAMETILNRMAKSETNEEFIQLINIR
ncbi:MAG: transcription termination factor Rho [Puniceicoccales bacterium]|jgi:transcription termination factor Rho|nr:transcription termination factor Rho [Puniceicoccales bacterium]